MMETFYIIFKRVIMTDRDLLDKFKVCCYNGDLMIQFIVDHDDKD